MAKPWKVEGIKPNKSYSKNAKIILPVRVEEVFSWADFVRDPDRKGELHNMRISIKRLRYSMEFFAINYGEAFGEFIKVVEDLQEVLGDIHDCDVVEEVLKEHLQNLQESEDAEIDTIGVTTLCSRYGDTRKAKYEAFVDRWNQLDQADFKGQLLEAIEGKRQKPPAIEGSLPAAVPAEA